MHSVPDLLSNGPSVLHPATSFLFAQYNSHTLCVRVYLDLLVKTTHRAVSEVYVPYDHFRDLLCESSAAHPDRDSLFAVYAVMRFVTFRPPDLDGGFAYLDTFSG